MAHAAVQVLGARVLGGLVVSPNAAKKGSQPPRAGDTEAKTDAPATGEAKPPEEPKFDDAYAPEPPKKP